MSTPEQQERPPLLPAGGISHSLRAFGDRDFALFWLGGFLANFGGWFQNLAIPYVLYITTQSAAWAGLGTVAQFLPGLFLGPVGGMVAERYELRLTLLWTQLVRAIIALMLFGAWMLDWHSPALILVLALGAGAAQGVQLPSWQAFIYHVTPRADLVSAVTLNSVQFILARSFGPALASLILLWWGPAAAFITAFLVIAIAIATLMPLPASVLHASHPLEDRAGVFRGFIEAIRYIAGQPGLGVALCMLLAAGLLGMPVFQHAIVFAEAVFHSGTGGLALLNLGLGLGTIVAVPLVAGFEHRVTRRQLAAYAMPLYALALALFGLSPTPLWGAAALTLVGICFLAVHAAAQNAVQIIVANEFRGRVLAVTVMTSGGANAAGAFLQGLLVDATGPRTAVLLASALLLFTALLMRRPGRHSFSHLNAGHDSNPHP